MQDLQAQIVTMRQSAEAIDEAVVEDEFDSYIENAMMQEQADSLKQMQSDQVDYRAVVKLDGSVAKQSTATSQLATESRDQAQDESSQLEEQFGEELMNRMLQEGSQEESHYVKEYNEVVA